MKATTDHKIIVKKENVSLGYYWYLKMVLLESLDKSRLFWTCQLGKAAYKYCIFIVWRVPVVEKIREGG